MSDLAVAKVPLSERMSPLLDGRRLSVATAALAVIALLVWLAALQLPDGQLHVAFLDVGQGDAIFITAPDGRQVLVDGGPSPTQLAGALGQQMPFWDRSIDLVVLTHPDDDHMTGLTPLFDRYRVARALTGVHTLNAPEALFWREAADAAGVPLAVAERGMQIDLGRGVRLDVLHPEAEPLSGAAADDNNNSVVLRLTHGEISFLLTGDLEAAGEQALLTSGQPLAAQVLKVSHHGSGGATTGEFLRAVAPQMAVIQVGTNNRFGHPAPETGKRLATVGAQVLRTDQHGTVEIISDGRQLRVRTAKRPQQG